MALPKLNTSPKYEIIIPSIQHKVRFRPYLVKEEKVLMMAMESQDQRQILNAVVDTIMACIDEPIQRSKLTTFDVEYLFTQIRSKSVGEVAAVGIKCSECKHQNKVEIKLDELKIDVPKIENTFEIQKGISIKMRWPIYDSMMNMAAAKNESMTQQTFDLIAECIDSVITNDEIISLKDEPKEEVQNFLESLSSAAFSKIKNFIDNMPRMKYHAHFHCEKCKHENDAKLEGINDFF
jgi:phage FluMu protein Com